MELVDIYILLLSASKLDLPPYHHFLGRVLQNYGYTATDAEGRLSQPSLHMSCPSYKSHESLQFVLLRAHPPTAELLLLLNYIRVQLGRVAERG